MSAHIGEGFSQLAGKHIIAVREETIASVDSMPMHRVIIRFDEGEELTIDLTSIASMSYRDSKTVTPRRKKSSKKRRR